MAVAEIFLGAFITVLIEKLTSSDMINLLRSAGIHSELLKWNNILVQIQAVLVDAGQKHIRETSVEVWLRNLQQLAYDIDNILDDLAYEVLRRQLKKESDHASTSTSSNRVRKIIPTCCTTFTPRKIVYGHNMGSKLDEITTRLLELVDQKKILGLTNKVERSIGTSRQVEQTSLVDVSKFVGREGDKEALLRLLKESCDENVSVVSIVGMGGMGKTTLANVLYKEVKDQFELSAWVCVSDEFNIFNISKAIFKDLGGEEKNFENLNQLHQALTEKLSQKRFLVVLDDVWNESYEKWEVFQRPFGVGAPGSTIIVTTRNTMVASVMDCVRPYHLKALSSEEALSLFAQHALGEPNFDSHPRLRVHGEGIIKKCDGLPLALRTLGRMLRRKTDVKVWEELLKSEIWSLQHGSDNILPALRLSYYDLPPHLKQMFAYCSLFPKDYVFDKDELVLLWMAEGFLDQTNGRKSMESLGHEHFEELQSRSFFQHSSANGKSQITMHDLINDLATSVAGEFFFRTNDGMGNEALEKFHHLSFIRKEYGRLYQKLKELHRASRLRTLLSLPVSANISPWFLLKGKVIVELLPHLLFLRVLSLTDFSIKEVPQSISSLKHIRYLNFSNTDITCIPEQVSDLYNLQSLLVRDCYQLSSLPHSFEKLINLRHLDIRGTPSLKKLPLGIGGLTSLQTLSKVIIDEDDGFKPSELKGLSDLHGRLSIMGLHKVKSVMHAQEAKLHQKEGLDDLEMEWSDAFYDSRNEYEVLEGLKPHDKLRKLKISFYNGTAFPYWVGDPSFDQLTELTLLGCRNCTCLPTLGHLGSLRSLYVERMNRVKTLDSGFLGPVNSCQGIAFPSLEVLGFAHMQDWEIWTTNGWDNNKTVGPFPRLGNISIRHCPKLAEVTIGSIPSLEVLRVEGCSELVLRNMVGVSSSIRRLEIEMIEGLTHLHGQVIKHLGAVEYLRIRSCNEVIYLWESETEACKILVNLRELNVISCEKLLAVGGKEVNLGICLKSVREMSVEDCKRLESYNCPNGIEKLTIEDSSSLTSLTFELPSTLKFLRLFSCNNLEESCFDNNFLSSLESLSIYKWSNLRSFREGCFAHLTCLSIMGCDDIESIPENGFGFLPHLCLRYLLIRGCKNLKSFPHHHLQSLASLKEMVIYDCPSLKDSFPCGSWPPNLTTLVVGNLKKPMSEWGSQNFPTSLATLHLSGKNSGVVSFAKEEDVMNTTSSCFLLPPSLTSLDIIDFRDLQSLSKGLQHLTCLEALLINSCPKLKDLPETLLPSLSYLNVRFCPELEKRCGDRKGDYWPIISEIPGLMIDD